MKKFLLTVIFGFALSGFLFAQNEQDSTTTTPGEQIAEVKGSVEGINETVLEMKSVLDALKKIKISGYIQAQFQSAEIDGANSAFQGGVFPSTMHNRFQVRRGRLKVSYDNDLSQYVLQLDATEKGVQLKDAYILAKEPWLKTFALKGGVFDRPFGFEISYSSSNREAPERSRLFQTLFPGERDLGASLEIFPTSGPLSYFNFKGGLFAGNGVNPEVDNAKDFIGRLGFTLPFYDANFAIDGGVSGYLGQVKSPAGKYYYTLNSAVAVDSSLSTFVDRNYIGFDLQLYYDLPIIGGFSLRGEYITGKQPGGKLTSVSPISAQIDNQYLREFYGYYVNYVQNLGDKFQLVVKYDEYDPNKNVSGDDIGAISAAKLGPADLKFSTLGFGLVNYFDDNVKFTFYYDMVKNETTNSIAKYSEDLKDNVFTVRMQYKF
jgi:phosphate-selective porin